MIFTHLSSYFLITSCIYTVIAFDHHKILFNFKEPKFFHHPSLLNNQKSINPSYFNDVLDIFSNNFYKTASKKNSNILLSPLSVNVILGMLAFGAEGNTASEILRILCLPSNDQLMINSYKYLIENLMNVQGGELKNLNKIYISKRLRVKKIFGNVITNNFHAQGGQLNFYNPNEAANSINTWVSRATNNKINNIVTVDDLNTDTAMVITNIVYFKGEWKYKFSNRFSFYFINYDNQTILVSNTMYRKAQFKYAHLPHIKSKVIELSYKGDELSMLIVLPDEVHGLDNVEKSLETITLRKLRKELSLTEVELALPKFHVEITNDLNDTLKEMGINQMFMSHANFRGITDGNLYVSKIKQKIVIDVSENGVEDTATTSGFFTNGMMGEHINQQFHANHAFHYKIIRTVGEHDGIALFAGNYKYI
ncbi:antichymotrypsin-2-like [Leptopilina boulardi]|uniref:antichymotrypsin-2-like n=1 Tax=Leptopilina boulardi TaxID=63433 RepID=UPI0021F6256E|nr:antichymotrypsin-2-like [Leptopilina boulardi]